MSTITVQTSRRPLPHRRRLAPLPPHFNFGPHYSPAHEGHGLLLVNNDDIVAPGQGFGTHGHRDMEIVTWVLSGRLEHRDSEGNHGVLYPGLAQRMSAGRGIRHSEMNASPDEPVHFVQMWVLPDTAGIQPGYEQRDLNDAPRPRRAGAASPAGRATPAPSTSTSGVRCCGADASAAGDSVQRPRRAATCIVFVALGSGALEHAGDLATRATPSASPIHGPPDVHRRPRRC